MWIPIRRRNLCSVALLALALGTSSAVPYAAAFQGPAVPGSPAAAVGKPTLVDGKGAPVPAGPVREPASGVGRKSQLAYPTGAAVWADARGTYAAGGPNPGRSPSPAAVREVRALVFQPRGGDMSLDGLAALYAGRGTLAPAAKAEFAATSPSSFPVGPPYSQFNVEETRVYKTSRPGEVLVLGLVRSLQTRQQVGYAVILAGKLTHFQAVGLARQVTVEIAAQSRAERDARAAVRMLPGGAAFPPVLAPPPVPAGVVAVRPMARLEGAAIQQLVQGIEQQGGVPPRVREMARAVISRATAILHSTWRSPMPIPDAVFVQFYLQAAAERHWVPVTVDQTQAGRPTLLFRKPNQGGMVLIRAQVEAAGIPGAPFRATTITILETDSTTPGP